MLYFCLVEIPPADWSLIGCFAVPVPALDFAALPGGGLWLLMEVVCAACAGAICARANVAADAAMIAMRIFMMFSLAVSNKRACADLAR